MTCTLPGCSSKSRPQYMLDDKQFKDPDMPRGPHGQKRPADTVANAIRVAKILTGYFHAIAVGLPLGSPILSR
jgi:hypothetical protein